MIGVFFFSGCAVGLIEPCGGNNLDELQNGSLDIIKAKEALLVSEEQE